MSNPDPLSETGQVAKLAPAAAQYPGWWRRNMTPGALWAIGATLFTATVIVTTFIVTVSHDSSSLATVITLARATNEDVKQIKTDVGKLNKWKDEQDTENRRIADEARRKNPYAKSRTEHK